MGTIDFHTHTFEDHIAYKAVDKLRRSANIRNYTDGTDSGLMKADSDNDISLSVVLPVATRILSGVRVIPLFKVTVLFSSLSI